MDAPGLDAERLAGVEAMIAEVPWRTSGTWDTPVGHVPQHQYVLSNWADPCGELVTAMRAAIAVHGYEVFKYGRLYRYLDVGDFYYWSIPVGRPPAPIVLNRQALPNLT
tara:strand:+ start:250 stop:576 length:327 start_codon:yes stop_codon:yes gene_type:complete